MRSLPLYVHKDRDRHGNVRLYFKRRGIAKKYRFRAAIGTPQFRAEYAACLAGEVKTTAGLARQPEGALQWLINLYYQSPKFKALAGSTQTTTRNIFKQVCAERVDADNPKSGIIGDLSARGMPPKALRILRDRWADHPTHANNMLAKLSALFTWAVEAEHMDANPAKDVQRLKADSEGFHTWTEAECRAYEAHHPLGTQARLAYAIMTNTGLRRSDAVSVAPGHLKRAADGERLQYRAKKNDFALDVPILADLREAIDAAGSPEDGGPFLRNSFGRPWKESGFSDRFKEWCREAGLPHCSAHGIRKAAACLAAERGATEAQMMAIFGWTKAEMATRYIRKAKRRTMADASMHLLAR